MRLSALVSRSGPVAIERSLYPATVAWPLNDELEENRELDPLRSSTVSRSANL